MKHEDWEKQKILEFIIVEHEDLDSALKWWWIKIDWLNWEFEMLSFFQSMTVLWGNAANFKKLDSDVLILPLSDDLLSDFIVLWFWETKKEQVKHQH